jgi:hypothetical protein
MAVGWREANEGLKPFLRDPYVFTRAAAALDALSLTSDRIEVFLLPSKDDPKLRQLDQSPRLGPRLRFIYPYDAGVFMYATFDSSIPRVSNIQAYLDLYAQGGRDLKRADYLLDNAIEPQQKRKPQNRPWRVAFRKPRISLPTIQSQPPAPASRIAN